MTTRTRRSRAKTTPTLANYANITFNPLLTDAQIKSIESAQPDWDVKRRYTLATLARSRQQLVEGFGSGNGPDLLLDMIGHISDYEQHCKSCAEMAASAVTRLMAVAAATIEGAAA